MNFQHAALNYAERGFHVFPLRPRDKVPLSGSRGELDATTDAATIAEWWRRCPDANVAIVPGASGLFVLDVDP
ncbi:MAG: bifunctional DNA primase/polymerase, partial [Deltaproteobacteria bacterium]|nr:bifunctional DNA primase/polymerase [Deltaproteobacteria bacterium]